MYNIYVYISHIYIYIYIYTAEIFCKLNKGLQEIRVSKDFVAFQLDFWKQYIFLYKAVDRNFNRNICSNLCYQMILVPSNFCVCICLIFQFACLVYCPLSAFLSICKSYIPFNKKILK